MAAWPKLILAEMSTIVYDVGHSRKVKKNGLVEKGDMSMWPRSRVAAWPKLISPEMSTIVYDGGCSRKVKTLKNRPPS